MSTSLTLSGDTIYKLCLNTFGVKKHQARSEPKKSRRQHEMKTLRKQKKNLRKQVKTANEEEKKRLHQISETLGNEQSRKRKEETMS